VNKALVRCQRAKAVVHDAEPDAEETELDIPPRRRLQHVNSLKASKSAWF
jgi:hypothetical protein